MGADDEQGGYEDEEQGGYEEQEQEQEPEQQYEQEPEPEPEPEPEYKEPEPEPEPEYEAPQEYSGDTPASVKDACDDIYSDKPSFNWFTTKLKDPKLKDTTLLVDQVGTGGLNELKQVVGGQADSILFFMLRVNTYDDESSSRAKFIYGRFVGSKVKFMQKAKLTPQLGAMADQF